MLFLILLREVHGRFITQLESGFCARSKRHSKKSIIIQPLIFSTLIAFYLTKANPYLSFFAQSKMVLLCLEIKVLPCVGRITALNVEMINKLIGHDIFFLNWTASIEYIVNMHFQRKARPRCILCDGVETREI